MFSNIFTVSKDHETMETKLFICTDLQIKHKMRMLTRMVMNGMVLRPSSSWYFRRSVYGIWCLECPPSGMSAHISRSSWNHVKSDTIHSQFMVYLRYMDILDTSVQNGDTFYVCCFTSNLMFERSYNIPHSTPSLSPSAHGPPIQGPGAH